MSLLKLDELQQRVTDEVARMNRTPTSGRTSIWAGSLARAHQCLRKAVLEITHARLSAGLPEHVQRIYAMGKLSEPMVRRLLEDIGFSLTQEQGSLRDGADLYPVSGKIDWRIAGTICELKTVGAHVWPKFSAHLDAGGSIADSPCEWHEAWHRQVQVYLWLAGEAEAVMIFWCKDALDVRTSLVVANSAMHEQFVELTGAIRNAVLRVDRALMATVTKDTPSGDLMAESVLAEIPPHPPLDEDPPCHDCSMRDVCLPGKRFKLVSAVCEDRTILQAIADAEHLSEAAKQKNKLREYAVGRYHAFREANLPDGNEFWLVFQDGSRFGGKRQSDGKWVPKFKPSRATEEEVT